MGTEPAFVFEQVVEVDILQNLFQVFEESLTNYLVLMKVQ